MRERVLAVEKIVSIENSIITKNGKSVAKLSSAKQSKVDIVKSLIGSVPDKGVTLQKAREERLSRHERTVSPTPEFPPPESFGNPPDFAPAG
jgi:antitoxin (DNA-binding transcriptional repressor) of toxin-antitoxin stability system